MSISELIDEWTPKFKIMEMVELLKKRLQQRSALDHDLKHNFLMHALTALPDPTIFILLMLAVMVCVGMGGFSGKGHAPIYGDLEAHRNWMAITVNRPVKEWYVQEGSDPWWPIDYPPLAAGLSYVLGEMERRIDPAAMRIQRGY
jgi:hypothetical protein